MKPKFSPNSPNIFANNISAPGNPIASAMLSASGKTTEQSRAEAMKILENNIAKGKEIKSQKEQIEKEKNLEIRSIISGILDNIIPEVLAFPPERLKNVNIDTFLYINPNPKIIQLAKIPNASKGKKMESFDLDEHKYKVSFSYVDEENNLKNSEKSEKKNDEIRLSTVADYATFLSAFKLRLEEEIYKNEKLQNLGSQFIVFFFFSWNEELKNFSNTYASFPFRGEEKAVIEGRLDDWMIQKLSNPELEYMEFLYHRREYVFPEETLLSEKYKWLLEISEN